MEFIFVAIGGLVIYAIINAIARSGGESLNSRFRKLGVMTGKSKR